MPDAERKESLSWPEIYAAISKWMTLPNDHQDPWEVDPVNPGPVAAAEIISSIYSCWRVTSILPDRVDASVNKSFVATYYRSGGGYAILEVDVEDLGADERPITVLCRSLGTGRIEDICAEEIDETTDIQFEQLRTFLNV